MATMEQIEKLAREYSVERGALVELVNELNNEMERAKRKYLGSIRRQVAKTKDAESALAAAIDRSRDLFVRPKTLVLHGVKCGLQKGKGGIAWEDEDFVLSRIEKLYADDAAMLEQLLIVKKRPRKEGLESLDVAALKKLGCTVVESGDQVVVKATDGEVDRLVAALLKDETEEALAA